MHIVIPAYGISEQLLTCIDALGRDARYSDTRVVVVDHGPSETVAAALAGRHDEVTCLRGGPELWWAGATNVGIRRAIDDGAAHVMLLNHDCYLEKGSLSRLLEIVEESPQAIVAPIQRDRDTRKVYWRSAATCFSLGFPTIFVPWKPRERPPGSGLARTRLIVGGRGVVIPVSAFTRIGPFDDAALPHYGADHDFFIRARRAGIPLMVALEAEVLIDHETTTLARRIGDLSVGEFRRTLAERRSHRNLQDVETLFRRHYPIRSLYRLGYWLHNLRYSAGYLLRRAGNFTGKR